MRSINYSDLAGACLQKGYRFFDEGDYNLNLIGVRATELEANTFNDRLCVAFRARGEATCLVFPATTDPGLYWRHNPISVTGTAILAEGQYPGLWAIGQHKGYEALRQVQAATVIRDNNRDSVLDLDAPRDTGLFGINCHRASQVGRSSEVNKWSAGCQVLADSNDFEILMALCHKAAASWGNAFSYTLLSEVDV